MPHPLSPHHPLSDESLGHISVDDSKDTLCAPVPLRPAAPIPTVLPRASTTDSTNMATSMSEHVTSRNGDPTFVTPTGSQAMQWEARNDFSGSNVSLDNEAFPVPHQYRPHSSNPCGYDYTGFTYDQNYNLSYAAPASSSCPRSYAAGLDLTGLSTIQEAYPPAAYQIEPQQAQETIDLADQSINNQLIQLHEDYEPFSPASHFDDYSRYGTPYESDTPCSTPAGDPPMPPPNFKPECVGDESTVDKEQPYAQLIFRALKEAPEHTMILRDIYEWFQHNTDKANDKETKGWQNSIRHNLSMNGAFEKVDHPTDDHSKKGFMWRLTEEAIRDGVKSTTRYRSKQPNKRSYRLHPQPQRQASGAKGGHASRRASRMRRSVRSEPAHPHTEPISRSVPYTFDTYMEPPTTPPATVLPFYSTADASAAEYTEFPALGFGPPPSSAPSSNPQMELFAARSFAGTPFSQQTAACDDSAHIELPIRAADPLFAASPSPSADEPRTPDEQMVGWAADVALAEGQGVYFDISYSEY